MTNQRAIEGKNVNVKFFMGFGWYPYACATNVSYSSRMERIEKSGPNTGRWKDWDLRMGEWDINLEGVTHIVPPPGIGTFVTTRQLMVESLRGEGLPVEMSFLDSAGNAMTISGFVKIPDFDIEAGSDGFSQDTLFLLGCGEPVFGTAISDTPDNPSEMAYDVKPGWFYGSDGQTTASLTHLINCELIEVSRAYPLEMIHTDTPTEQQVKFAVDGNNRLTTGTLEFGAPLGPQEFVFYQYKKY